MRPHAITNTIRSALMVSALAIAISACNQTTRLGGDDSTSNEPVTTSDGNTGDNNTGNGGSTPTPTVVDYATVNSQVLQKRCTSCHGSSGGVNLQTYNNVYNNRSRVRSAVVNGRMPPGSPLTSSQKTMLINWIDAGAPQSAAAAATATAGVMMNEDGTLSPTGDHSEE